MSTKLLERSTDYTKLKERQADLKAKELALRREWQEAAFGPDAQKKQAEISTKLRETSAELVSLGPLIAASKEAGKAAGLQHLLADPAYKAAVTSAAQGLSEALAPWLPLLTLTLRARRSAIAAPQLPQAIGQAYVEGKIWLASMIRLGVLDVGQLPASLRSLVEEG